MSSSSKNNNGGILVPLLLVLFIGLKLGNVINWSWFWVLSPLWIPFAAVTIFFAFLPLLKMVVVAIDGIRQKSKLKRMLKNI